jgi:ATP-dependent helicase/nuclease subunit B
LDATLYQLLKNGATLLTASRHLSHALQLEYAQAAQQHGLQVWPSPHILPWSTYLRTACQLHRNERADAVRLLSEQQALALWERIVAASDSGKALLNPTQAARNAQRSWQRAHQHLIPLHKVAAYPGEEAQAFTHWAQEFVDATQHHRWLDSARFSNYLHNNEFKPDTDLIVYGFDQRTPDMQQLLQHWQTQGVTIHQLDPVKRQANTQVVAAKDSQAELKLAASWARAQAEQGARVAVVIPRLTAQAAQVTRRFTDVFAPAQRRIDQTAEAVAFHVAATPALSSYPLVHHALLLLQLLKGRADVLLIGQLLRSPFIAGYEAEAAQRALADIAAREERREYWNCNELERLAARLQCVQLAGCMQATSNYLREHQQQALPSQWTERFSQLLKLSGWSRGRSLDSTEQQTLSKLLQLLAELSALDELLGKINLATAVGIVRDACNAESYAPEGLDQQVTVLDVDSSAGMLFDAVWVMGLHAGDWPAAPEPDPFLPIELQRQYAVPEASAELCLRLARHKLQRLAHAADNVVFSWPQHDADAELQASPLLGNYATTECEPLALATTRALSPQLFMQRPDMETLVDDIAPALTPGAARGGTRILELQSRCPFRAQAELRLHAEPVPSVSPAVEATERGKLVHRVLTEVWQYLKDSAGLKAAIEASDVGRTSVRHSEDVGNAEAAKPDLQEQDLEVRVRSIATRVAQQVIPATTTHRQRLAALEVELCTQWIMSLLYLEAERLPFRVHRAEQIESYELAGMTIRIQLDRIDELTDGGMLLIDYKTGVANNASDWLDRFRSTRARQSRVQRSCRHRQHRTRHC